MRVFLTGGTGLLGSHVAEHLRARGHTVVALVRPTSRTEHLRRVGAELVTGDLTDPEPALARAAGGCDATIHAAALLYRRDATEVDYQAVNVDATERLLRAAGAAGARRAVLVSSTAVYGAGEPGELHTEDSWLRHPPPARVQYARSKREGEQAAWRLHGAGVVRLSTVRPGVLYGERDRWFTAALARTVGWPAVPLPAGGRCTVPVVYAGNAAVGVVAALEREEAVGEAYNLSEDAPLTVRALIENFARGLSRRPVLVAVPGWAVLAVAAVGDGILRLLPAARGADADLRRAARRLLEDNAYPAEKARRALDWGARVPPALALERTARWWLGMHAGAEEVGQR